MERVKVKFTPVWSGAVEGYAVNLINKTVWKTAPVYVFEDLYQEAYLMFIYVRDRYPHVTAPSHFMSLFMMACQQKFLDLANKRTSRREVSAFHDEDGVSYNFVEEAAARPELEDEFELVLADAPEPIRVLLKQFYGPDVPNRRVKMRKTRCGTRETLNQHLCRLAGVSEKQVDMPTELECWLAGENTCFM